MLAATSRCNRHDCTYKCEEKKKREPATASSIRGYATPIDAAPCSPATALERNLHIGRWESNQDETPQPEQTTARPKDKHPVRPFCATKPKPPSQRRTRRSKEYENLPVHAYQPVRLHVINRSTHGANSNVDSNTLRGLVCCGSALAYPCCRHGRWSCARWSCPRYCVGWARIACQR
jgi:hypothetical protein